MSDTATIQYLQSQEPEVLKWLESNAPRRDFAASVNTYLNRKGYITAGQLAAVQRCIERESQPAPPSPDVDTTKLEAAFAKAASTGLRSPALTIGGFRFSPAPATGKNPGAVYVKQDGVYLGKMLNGKLLTRLTGDFVKEVLAIAADPKGEAIKHGHLTGRCSVCSRKLSDPESTARGMGPICADRYGW